MFCALTTDYKIVHSLITISNEVQVFFKTVWLLKDKTICPLQKLFELKILIILLVR